MRPTSTLLATPVAMSPRIELARKDSGAGTIALSAEAAVDDAHAFGIMQRRDQSSGNELGRPVR